MHKILIIIIIFFTCNSIGNAQTYTEINLESPTDFTELNTFFNDTILSKYRVYFTGENHQFAYVNSELEFKFLIYLHQTQGVKHFMFEQSPATGFIITQAVTDNNDISYKLHLKDKFFDPFYDLVKNIKKYNDTLAPEDKIIVHGIDVERFPSFSIYALHKITDSLNTNGATGVIYESIDALYSSDFKDADQEVIYNGGGERFNLLGDKLNAWETIKTIVDRSEKYKDVLKDELGENFDIYFDILKGLENGHDWYLAEKNGDLTAPVLRERFMIEEFMRVYNRYKNAKFYGQFGRCHLHAQKEAKKCYSHNMQSIAGRINNSADSSLSGKVLTIPVYYKNSKTNDIKVIEALNLDDRFNEKNKIYLVDLSYLNNDNPLEGFNDELPYVIINTYYPKATENVYSFNVKLEEFHLGLYYGNTFFNKINRLNAELTDKGITSLANKMETYSIFFEYYNMHEAGQHFSYNIYPEITNNDNLKLKGQSFTYGGFYPIGNRYITSYFGVFFTYGMVKLIEVNQGSTPNLIQLNNQNAAVYRNDIFQISPNLDLKLTLPVVSINTRIGYNFDVSNKYWKLDSKVKDFTKTSFTSPYVQIGASLNLKYQN